MSETTGAESATTTRSRDAIRTQATILEVAVGEFAEHGFHGARVERITKHANCNSRMIYHYFGSKEGLYVAVLEHVFEQIRTQEAQLDFDVGDPAEKMKELVTFTFDYFANNGNFRKLTRNENLLNGKYIARSHAIRDMSQPLIAAIDGLIARGCDAGVFQSKPDAVQLYLTIVALSAHHLNNAATLGAVVGQDLHDPMWQSDRRAHAVAVVQSYLGISET
ncbi:TetR/AcrR family transcriptional regulator [Yoonia sediminilitoris]|uniref:TetR family transcriptional regulator n=1 Tax=Yoonia sediminilitoris TaxID=1286148 RepID=A0A2T6KMG0_9RHOB|nr:TetR/AcrR family transcriptional regulator [Yoonia sediminilitoris]PUB17405.1 TetR family transcriptional regulator [Yoonia sediminilitoris]RCW97700.1 TetR family transcriptional regulator [Yoonia sediminilitoris]